MHKLLLAALLLASEITFAQNKQINKKWKAVDSLELTGKIESADSLITEIISNSTIKSDPENYIKAKIFHYKFYQINHEKSNIEILSDLNKVIDQSEFPFKNVLYSYKAEFLLDYLHNHRWQINKRKQISNPDVSDINTWSAKTLIDSIKYDFNSSLKRKEELTKFPVNNIEFLLNASQLNRKLKPSLYDVLAQAAIDFYSNSSDFTEVSSDSEFKSPALYSLGTDFVDFQISEEAQKNPKLIALQIYQHLQKLHNGDTLPYIYSILSRLEFVNSSYAGANKETLYLNSLKKLAEDYKSKPAEAYVLNVLAQEYYSQASNKTEENDSLKNPGYLKKAVQICTKIIQKFPDTKNKQEALKLKAIISHKNLSAKIEEYILPEQTSRILVNYKNVDTLNIKVFRINSHYFEKINYKYKDSLVIARSKQKLTYSEQIQLPRADDYNNHSTEILLPAFKKGTYIVFLSDANSSGRRLFTYGEFQVTEIAVSKTEYSTHTIFHTLNRDDGSQLENVSVKKSISDSEKRFTDKNGFLSIPNSDRPQNFNYIFSKNGDTLTSNLRPGYYFKLKNNEPVKAKTLLFLDRAIYRPGQEVFFKGILLKNFNDKTTTVPGEYVEVYVEDANANEIKSFRLKTNKYGSFSEKFILPKTGITGNFSIYTEEDTDSDTEFWNNIWDDGEYLENAVDFKVEEYKRPSFKVSFKNPDIAFKLNDTVRLKGKVNSFLGANLTDQKVIYTVTRQEVSRYWWQNSYSEEVQIAHDSVTTDKTGNFNIAFPSLAPENKLQNDVIYRYTIAAEVTDVSGETRTASTSINLGRKNLKLTINSPEVVEPGDNLKIALTSTDLNNNPVTTRGTLKIYKLKAPERILHERLWEAPEINLVSREDFIKYFPEEPYKNLAESKDWEKQQLVSETEYQAKGNYELNLQVKKSWPSGKYLITARARDSVNSVETSKEISISNSKDNYLADNQQFIVKIENENISREQPVLLEIKTAYKQLNVEVLVFDGYNKIFNLFTKINGHKTVEIPIKNIGSEELKIRISAVKNNSRIIKELNVNIPKKKKFLQFNTETFRNKIEPDTKETWSFKIKNQDNEMEDAEYLASMYDASLDQFIVRNWQTEPDFSYHYNSYPSFSIPNIEQVTPLYPRNTFHIYYSQKKRKFDELDKFGFIYSEPDSYYYKRYLSKKKKESEKKRQPGNAVGIVTDNDGQPLPGVNVRNLNTQKGTQTDFDGEFKLDIHKNDILQFSYIGFRTFEYVVGKEKEIYVSLEENMEQLNEVVTIGYGIQAKSPHFESQGVLQSLNGKVSGLEVLSETEGASTVRIRGAASLSGNQSALFIIDGKPVSNDGIDLQSSDILNIQVLKGTEATALYGEKGKNGVVIITTKRSLEELSKVKARKNLSETAFFYPHLTTDSTGTLKFSFTSPEALTEWKLRILGHTKNWSTGEYTAQIRTQKELSITPNAPRFLRENDSIVLKTKISNLTEKTMNGIVKLQLFNAVNMQPLDTILANEENIKNFVIHPKNDTSVSWKLFIPTDLGPVTYRILAKSGDFSDGEENLLPVLSNRMLVTESIPLFVRGKTTKNFEFKNLKNSTSPTLKNHKFTLEYTSNPAWFAIQSLPYLMEFEHECSEQTFARLYANSIAAHILNSQPKIKEVFRAWKKDSSLVSNLDKNEDLKSIINSETPWVRDAESETEKKNRLGELFDADRNLAKQNALLIKLKNMQNSNGAFPWFQGGEPNPYITRHILAGLGHLHNLGIEINSASIEKKAVNYIDDQFLKNYREYSDKAIFYDAHRSLHYLYTRSYYLKDYPLSKEIKSITDTLVAHLKSELLEGNLYDSALKILIFENFNEKAAAIKLINALKQQAVKSEILGMYWKSNTSSWYWYRAPIETQALLIEGFENMGNQQETVEEMKIWLLQNKRTNNWPTTKSTTEASYALLMRGNDWLSLKDNTIIRLGDKPIATTKLEETKKEAGSGYFKINWKPEEIDKSFSKITVENNSSHAGFGGAYWQYFENLDKIKSENSDSPLSVQKELYLNKNSGTENSLKKIDSDTPIHIGDLITVRLVVKVTSDMDYIHLKDMRASGFEPTNVLSRYKYQDGTAYYESTRDAATHFFFDSLKKGTYVLEYTVRANNAGTFSNGITTLQSMYAPEFSSHTKGIRVTIKE